MKKDKLRSIIFLCVFLVLSLGFFVISALVQKGVFPNMELQLSVQALLASSLYLPLFISIFFLAQHLKSKPGIWQNIYKILTFVSVALGGYAAVMMIISFCVILLK